MNKVVLAGRLTKDPELRATASGASVCNFTVAVDRRYTQNGERQADFISCIAWRQSGEFVARYFKKGNRIILDGSIQTRSWDDGGSKHYATEVVVDHVEFGEPSNGQKDVKPAGDIDEFIPVSGEDLPF